MYSCKIYFDTIEEKKELEKLLNLKFIRSISFENNYCIVRTRKFWKLYWFNYHFKKFKHSFSYSKVFNEFKKTKIPSQIKKHFEYETKYAQWQFKRIFVYFDNIHSVWKIRFWMMFL